MLPLLRSWDLPIGRVSATGTRNTRRTVVFKQRTIQSIRKAKRKKLPAIILDMGKTSPKQPASSATPLLICSGTGFGSSQEMMLFHHMGKPDVKWENVEQQSSSMSPSFHLHMHTDSASRFEVFPVEIFFVFSFSFRIWDPKSPEPDFVTEEKCESLVHESSHLAVPCVPICVPIVNRLREHLHINSFRHKNLDNRAEWIRTIDPLVPNQVRYHCATTRTQAEMTIPFELKSVN